MSKSMIDYLRHILVECEYLEELKQNGLTKAELLEDETKKRAIVRSLEIIGEATKNIEKPFREKFPRLNWKQMAGMRDRLIHNYMGVNYNIVWDVIETKIPHLKLEIERIIDGQE
ncbi:MAG: DUF86 domain-containing protein [Phaeodactylibacter sp.]|nr:DUF86 domain-containing protein [Phaeodactylibacter sp.]